MDNDPPLEELFLFHRVLDFHETKEVYTISAHTVVTTRRSPNYKNIHQRACEEHLPVDHILELKSAVQRYVNLMCMRSGYSKDSSMTVMYVSTAIELPASVSLD